MPKFISQLFVMKCQASFLKLPNILHLHKVRGSPASDSKASGLRL